MKTKDFETAIAALNVGIVIDEMKLRHSDVRQVIAHQGSWKSHTNLTHAGKYFRPSKVKITSPTLPK